MRVVPARKKSFVLTSSLLSLIITLTVIISVAATPQIENLILSWNGHPVQYFNPNHETTVFLYFNYTSTQDITSITIDYRDLNTQRELTPFTIQANMCLQTNVENLYECRVPPPIPFRTSITQPIMKFTFTNDSSEQTQLTKPLELILDQTNPQLTFLGTNKCFEGTCYIASGAVNTIRMTIQDEIASFNHLRLFYSLNGQTHLIEECTSSFQCTGRANINCNDATPVRLAISSYAGMPSSDDAGNRLQGTDVNLICDAQAPNIIASYQYSTASGLPAHHSDVVNPFVAIGDTLTIRFNVTERVSPQVNVSIDLTSIGGEKATPGSCQRHNEVFRCTISFPVQASGPLTNLELPITVTDFAGNTAQGLTDPLDIVLASSDGTPHDWDIQSINPQKQQANKQFLEYTPKTLYSTLQLQPKGSSQTILDVKTGSCQPITDSHGRTHGTNGDVQAMRIISYSPTSILLTNSMNMGAHYNDYSQTKYNCSVEVLTKKGDYINRNYERVDYVLTVDFHNTRTLGAQVQREVQGLMEKQEQEAQRLLVLKQSLQKVGYLCAILGHGKSTGGAMSAAGAPLMLVPDPTQTVQGIGRGLDRIGTTAQETTEKLKSLVWMCEVMSCESKYNLAAAKLIDEELPGVKEVSNILGYESYAETLNPWDSWITAMLMVCPPAIIYHEERKTGFDCEYAQCLLRDVQSGIATIEDCQKRRDYALCVYNKGAIFNAIPFANALKKTMQTVVQTASNPLSIFLTGGMLYGCLSAEEPSGVSGMLCRAGAGINGAAEAYKTFDRILSQFEQMMQEPGRSACEQVRANIDTTRTDWYYREPTTPDFNFNQERQLPNNQVLRCTEFSGCTTTWKDQNNIERKITVFPTSSGAPRVIFDGKYEQSNNDYYKRLWSTELERLPRDPEQWTDRQRLLLDQQMQLEAELQSLVSEASQESTSYMHEVRQAAGPEYQSFLDAYEQATAQEARYQTQMPVLLDQQTQATNQYNAIRNYDKALENIGRANERFASVGNDMAMRYAQAQAAQQTDDMRLIENVLNCGGSCQSTHFHFDAVRSAASSDLNVRLQEGSFSRYDDYKDIINDMRKARQDHEKGTKDHQTIQGLPDYDGASYEGGSIENIPTREEGKRLAQAEKDTIDAAEQKAKEAKTQADERVENAESNRAQSQRRAEFEQYLTENWRSWSRALRTSLRFANNVNSFTPWFTEFIGWKGAKAWEESVIGFLRERTGAFGEMVLGNWEHQFCERKLGSRHSALQVHQTHSITYQSAAHVQGIRIKNGYDEHNYTYVVNAYVANLEQDESLMFDIRLKGTGHHELVERTSLARGEAFTQTRNDPLLFDSTQYFTEVCIRFHNDNLWKWFGETKGNSEFCRRLDIG